MGKKNPHTVRILFQKIGSHSGESLKNFLACHVYIWVCTLQTDHLCTCLPSCNHSMKLKIIKYLFLGHVWIYVNGVLVTLPVKSVWISLLMGR